MKDNNENLSNELNDDEMEAVAGGGKSDWSKAQKTFLKSYLQKYCGPGMNVNEVVLEYSPKEFLTLLECNGGYDMVKKGLGL